MENHNNQITLIVAIYVDDFLLFWENSDKVRAIKKFLSSVFKMKDMGTAKHSVGLRISRDNSDNLYQSMFILIFCDNQGAIYLAKNDAFLPRIKHIDIKHHFVRDSVSDLKMGVIDDKINI